MRCHIRRCRRARCARNYGTTKSRVAFVVRRRAGRNIIKIELVDWDFNPPGTSLRRYANRNLVFVPVVPPLSRSSMSRRSRRSSRRPRRSRKHGSRNKRVGRRGASPRGLQYGIDLRARCKSRKEKDRGFLDFTLIENPGPKRLASSACVTRIYRRRPYLTPVTPRGVQAHCAASPGRDGK